MAVFKGFLAGLLSGCVLAILALNFHLVHSTEGIELVRRAQTAPLRSTYVDIRQWSGAMWQQYPEVAAALTQAGRTDLLLEGLDQGKPTLGGPALPPITVPDPLLPSAQLSTEVVPIRFLDPLEGLISPAAQQPDQQPVTPAQSIEEGVSWEEFLRRATSSVHEARLLEQSQFARKTSPDTTAEKTLPNPAQLTPTGYTVSTQGERPSSGAGHSQAAPTVMTARNLTDGIQDSFEQSTRQLREVWQAEAQAAPGTTIPLPLNSQNSAPQRQWVQGLLESTIPQSTIPKATAPVSPSSTDTLQAPAPGKALAPTEQQTRTLFPQSRSLNLH
jgi:hypothetical protein